MLIKSLVDSQMSTFSRMNFRNLIFKKVFSNKTNFQKATTTCMVTYGVGVPVASYMGYNFAKRQDNSDFVICTWFAAICGVFWPGSAVYYLCS
jgi:hypothetical protein